MRVAVLAFSALPRDVGGAQIFTFNLVRELLDRSHEVHFYVPRKYVRDLAGIAPRNGTLRIIPISFFEYGLARWFPFAIQLALLVRQWIHRYDIWQTIGAYPAGFVARRLVGRVPVVLRSYGEDIQKEESLRYGLRLDPSLERRIMGTVPLMARLVALTPTVRDCYLELGAAADRIEEIPNAIEYARFQGAADRKAVRSRLGIDEGRYLILSTGRYHVKKGYEYVLPAAGLLRRKGFDFQWLIVGKGVSALEGAVRAQGLEGTVRLVEGIGVAGPEAGESAAAVPSRPLIDLYKSADLYVLPSLLETFGMVLIEAMAAGLPVVTTDAPGCRDVVTDGVDGLKARPGDGESLAECVSRVMVDGDLRDRLVANAAATARSHDWRHVADRYESLYASLAGAG